MEWPGGTAEQYDAVNAEIGHEPFGQGPPELLFHWMTVTDTGIRITDVWQNAEAFEKFAAEEIEPATQKAGIDTEPQITLHDVHNYITAG